MFNNVLVGVDGRPSGRDAIALASRLIDPNGKLTLAHVHSGPLHPSHAVTPGLLREEREASAKLLEQERAAGEVNAELVSVVAMSAGRGLHQQAEEQDADLLVVGSCSRGVLGRAMLGDDTRSALNGAPCAIAIASLGYAEHPTPLGKIGVGYDGSPESKLALQTRPRARTVHQGQRRGARSRLAAHLRIHRHPPARHGREPRRDASGGQRPHERAARRGARARRMRPRRRGARRVRQHGRSAHRRLTRLRPDEADDARQHLKLPGAPRALLTARTAPQPPRRDNRRGTVRRTPRAHTSP